MSNHARNTKSLVWAITLAVALFTFASPAQARESLGLFGQWGAFRDADVPRCYAIAKPTRPSASARYDAFASVGTWPRRGVRGQFHLRLSQAVSPASTIRLVVGNTRFELVGGGNDAWAQDQRMDAAILAAMRSARSLSVSARSRQGRTFTDGYSLEGVATALDAATVGCARLR